MRSTAAFTAVASSAAPPSTLRLWASHLVLELGLEVVDAEALHQRFTASLPLLLLSHSTPPAATNPAAAPAPHTPAISAVLCDAEESEKERLVALGLQSSHLQLSSMVTCNTVNVRTTLRHIARTRAHVWGSTLLIAPAVMVLTPASAARACSLDVPSRPRQPPP
eukprot:1176453-Rhodomonas_salina.2